MPDRFTPAPTFVDGVASVEVGRLGLARFDRRDGAAIDPAEMGGAPCAPRATLRRQA